MLNISEELKNILRNDRFPLTDTITPKDLEITFDGMDSIHADQMVDDSFSLTESIISDNDIRFGACVASQIKFKLANVPEDLKGREFTIDQLIGATDVIPLGKYKVDSAKLQDDLIFKEVIAYDKLKDIDVDVSAWYNSLFPTGEEAYTLKDFRSSLLTYLGIDEASQTLANDDMIVTKTIEPTQISGRTVLEATVELNGAFGNMNRQGEFRRIVLEPAYGLYPSETLYPSEDLYPVAETDTSYTQEDIVADIVSKAMYQSVRFEEYSVKEIDKLIIRAEEDDIGAIVGTGTNTYIIEGNFLVFGKSAEDLEQIALNAFGNMAKRPYRPYTAQSIGLPYIEVGDCLEFDTDDTVVGYVLQRTLIGIQALKDEFEAPGSEEREQNFGINKEIIQLQGKTATIKKSVEEVSATVSDLEEDLTGEISVLAGQVVLKVDSEGNIGYVELDADPDTDLTAITIKADNIALEGLITANGNFKILTDGSIEAVNGKFSGNITGSTISGGTISGGTISGAEINSVWYNDGDIITLTMTKIGYSLDIEFDDGSNTSSRWEHNGIYFSYQPYLYAPIMYSFYGRTSMNIGDGFTADSSGAVTCSTINGDTPVTTSDLSSYVLSSTFMAIYDDLNQRVSALEGS